MKKHGVIFFIAGALVLVLSILWWQNGRHFFHSGDDSHSLAARSEASFDLESPFRSIHSHFLAALAIYPQNLSRLVDFLAILKSRFTHTQLWQYFNLDKALEEFNFRQVLGQRAERNLSDKQVNGLELLLLAQDIFRTGKEFFLAASQDKFVLDSQTGIQIPSLYGVARFTSDVIPARARDVVLRAIKSQTPESDIRLAALDESNLRIEFSLRRRPSIGGLLILHEKDIQVTLGIADEKQFLASGSQESMFQSSLWTRTAPAFPPSPIFVGLLDYRSAWPILDGILNHASQGSTTAFSTSSLTNFESVGLGATIGNGLEFRQCATLKSDSNSRKNFEEYVSEVNRSSSHSEFERLVTAQTIFGLRIPRRLLFFLAREYGRSLTPSAFSSIENDASWKGFLSHIDDLEGIVSHIPFEELGILINAGPHMLPEFGLFLGGGDTIAIRELAQRLNEVIKVLGAGLSSDRLPEARIVEVPGTGPFEQKLEIMAGGEAISFIKVSNNAMFASGSQELLDSVPRLIRSSSPLLPVSETAAQENPRYVANSDYYFVLNTTPLLELAKPFIPLLLMQEPELKISAPQVEEVLNLLSFRLFAEQTTLVDSSVHSGTGTLCGGLRIQTY